jgi:hypothetical protein
MEAWWLSSFLFYISSLNWILTPSTCVENYRKCSLYWRQWKYVKYIFLLCKVHKVPGALPPPAFVLNLYGALRSPQALAFLLPYLSTPSYVSVLFREFTRIQKTTILYAILILLEINVSSGNNALKWTLVFTGWKWTMRFRKSLKLK